MVKFYKNCFSQVELVGRVNTGTSYTLYTQQRPQGQGLGVFTDRGQASCETQAAGVGGIPRPWWWKGQGSYELFLQKK